MTSTDLKTSPVRAVILNVSSLEEAKKFYQEALGMECLDEIDDLDASTRALWGLGAGKVRMACMGRPEEPFGRVELLAWDGCSRRPLRDQRRPFDYGILTLNLRTLDLLKAIDHLGKHGAELIAKPIRYPYQPGAFLYEAMVVGPNGERYTLLQLGEPQPLQGHVIGDVVATVGTVVPDSASAKAFYVQTLGLAMAFEMDEPGEMFAPLLGMASDFRMRMNLFAAGDSWTGKIETIEFTAPSADRQPACIKTDWRRSGYCMLSLISADPEQLFAALSNSQSDSGHRFVAIERPFFGPARALLVNGPGGVPLEILTEPGEDS